MSAKPDGDPVVDAQVREGTAVDDALESFVGCCRGCHHQVRANADGTCVCAECGLDAAPVLEEARRLRAHPRAATWLAWSMIALGAALWMRAYGGFALLLSVVQSTLYAWWPAAVAGVQGPAVWLAGLCNYGIWLVSHLAAPLVIAGALAGVLCSLRAMRTLDRKTLVLALLAVAGLALECAEALGWWLVIHLNPEPYGWSARSRVGVMRKVVFELLWYAGPMVALVAFVLALSRRWPVRAPRRLVHVVVVATAIVILDVVARIATSAIASIEAITHGEGVGLVTPEVIAINHEIQQARLLYLLRQVITSAAAITAFSLLGWLLCGAGHSIGRMRTVVTRPPESAARLERRRFHGVMWMTAVFASTIVLTGVLLPLFLNLVDQSWWRSVPIVTAFGVPFMLPVIGGAVRGSWRFALLLIAVSMLAAALGGAAASVIWN